MSKIDKLMEPVFSRCDWLCGTKEGGRNRVCGDAAETGDSAAQPSTR